MASITTDYIAELRDALTRHLLEPNDIVSKTKSLEETIWEQLTAMLPKEALSKNLFSDKDTFESYRQLVTTTVTKSWNEEELLTKHMREKPFAFSLEIAIDAYPAEGSDKNNQKPGNKTGVLTFYIEGIPSGVVPRVCGASEEEKSESAKVPTKKRKAESEKGKTSDKDKLLEELALTEFRKKATMEDSKRFPATASMFFEALNRWFSSVVSRRSAKLEKDKNRNPLYH